MPCVNISVLSKAKFQGDFNIETLKQALLTIPGVMGGVQDMGDKRIRTGVNIAGRIEEVTIVVQNNDLFISGVGCEYITRKVPQHYNALVQTQILRKMGFNTKVEVRGENIMVQAVK